MFLLALAQGRIQAGARARGTFSLSAWFKGDMLVGPPTSRNAAIRIHNADTILSYLWQTMVPLNTEHTPLRLITDYDVVCKYADDE